ncbi:MAG TPA: hypothetical protein VI341_09975 [Actinomycetota bacterium]
MKTRRVLKVAIITAVIAAVPAVALASWGVTGSGTGSSRATSVQGGSAPTASVTGRNVTVSWGASTMANGSAVSGYHVIRYNTSNVAQVVGASCSGTVAALTCTEAAVPAGTWTYSVTPMRGLWAGAESAKSSSVVVSPPSLSFSSVTTISTVPTTLNGTVGGFVTGETLTFRLDNATSGTVLSTVVTPSTIPANGSASVAVTIPAGTAVGSHTVFAVGSLGTQASAGFVRDTSAPTVAAATIQKSGGGTATFIKQGGGYYVYANVTDNGSPAVGVGTVTANVTNITTGSTAAPMSSGSWTVGATTYAYRSALLTANAVLTAGAKTYTITAADLAGNSATSGTFSVTVENTAPTVTAVAIQKSTGGTAGVVRRNGTYYVYANAADTGGAGLESVTTNVNSLTAGQTAVTMSAGSWTVGATTYGFRSSLQTVDGSTAQGTTTFTVTATDGAGNTTTPAATNVIVDNTAPTVTSVSVYKAAGGSAGYIRQAGTYYVYANVSDSGGGALQTITADASSLTTGQTTITMTAGSYTVGSSTFNYRTALQTASNPLTAGTTTVSVTATDTGGNSTQTSSAVTVDNTAPAASDIQTTNVGGGTTGRAEAGDTIVYTFTEAIEPVSILAAWTGGSTNVTVRLNNNGVSDNVTIYNATNATQLPLGTITLNRTDYTTGSRTFTGSTMVMSGSTITITLGTASGATTTAAATATMSWTPSATATDLAGNACSTTARTEGGTADKEF